MIGFRKGKGLPSSPIAVAVTEPLLEHRIATKFVSPDSLRHVPEEDLVIDVQIAG
jgi:hypothetical protein